MTGRLPLVAVVVTLSGLAPQPALAQSQARPNIVLMFPDNLGWGKIGVYGGVRGSRGDPTSRAAGRARPRLADPAPPRADRRALGEADGERSSPSIRMTAR